MEKRSVEVLCTEQLCANLTTLFLYFLYFLLIFYQVATPLLVAGSTLTFWIPWQTLFASTSLYSSVVQSAMLLV